MKINAILILIVAALVWTLTPSQQIDANSACDTPEVRVQQQDAIVVLVNEARVKAGLHPLSINGALTAAAERTAVDMATHRRLDHVGSDGSSFVDRIQQAGYNGSLLGENLLYQGRVNANSAFRMWMASRGHRDNILQPGFTEIGVSLSCNGRRAYYAMSLGAP
jgi:uncharacterized protein YkwD